MSFPTTPILDTFTRADENPLSDGGKWTTPLVTGNGQFEILSNQAVDVSAPPCNAYWNVTQFGPDCEAYVDVPTYSSIDPVYVILRAQSPGASPSYYLIGYYGFLSAWHFENQIGSLHSVGGLQAPVSGDTIGGSVIGTTMTAYLKHSGVWQLIASFTDSSISGPGFVGFYDSGFGVSAFANFGGGTYGSASSNAGGQGMWGGWVEGMPASTFEA